MIFFRIPIFINRILFKKYLKINLSHEIYIINTPAHHRFSNILLKNAYIYFYLSFKLSHVVPPNGCRMEVDSPQPAAPYAAPTYNLPAGGR